MKCKQTLKVLLVEDNQFDRRMMESMLSEHAHAIPLVKSSESLAGALDLLQKHEFDVVVLDLNLSDSHGEETLNRLTAQCSSVAVVVNTGAYEDEVGLETLSSGAQDFLVKGKYDAYIFNKSLRYAVERKRVESELLETYRKLKEAQANLIQAEKMKVIGGLASGVAHEVKNPLATLLYGLTYISQRISGKDQQVDGVLENMKQAIHRANDIIMDLLNFSSLTTLSKKDENLEEVVSKALDLVNHEVARQRINLVKNFERSLPAVRVDKNRIEQVLINLILNAVHATPEGGEIVLNAYSRVLSSSLEGSPRLYGDVFKPGDRIVVLTVEDNGCGIPAEMIDRIFDPFFTTRRGSGGVGLGLSVSKSIMDIHKGCICVENKEGGGARATLVFKAAPGQGGVIDEQAENINYR
ncbi:MAG: hypothetical protein A3C36_04990 [Omnitrophica WOR_2 bacterium RIFCSPHIGHO2_02_FULL_52_10]|nr:MAG: hypothetical protein A3C36_04990 [Omnitrophica WOR_2 bacterium RIFCSPHIGHO2_02_FULL_52_10]